jgi:PPOX class probable F420-dependent enzyme
MPEEVAIEPDPTGPVGDGSVRTMRHDIDSQIVENLLSEQHLATLATHRKDGSVLLSPLWYSWEDGRFQLGISAGDIKLRHMARDPRVTIVVAEEIPPYRGIEVRGIAHIDETDYPPRMRALARRYLGPSGDEIYGDDDEGAIVTIEPTATRTWDFDDDLRETSEKEA